MLPSTEIFSKRRKIFSIWKGTGVLIRRCSVPYIRLGQSRWHVVGCWTHHTVFSCLDASLSGSFASGPRPLQAFKVFESANSENHSSRCTWNAWRSCKNGVRKLLCPRTPSIGCLSEHCSAVDDDARHYTYNLAADERNNNIWKLD